MIFMFDYYFPVKGREWLWNCIDSDVSPVMRFCKLAAYGYGASEVLAEDPRVPRIDEPADLLDHTLLRSPDSRAP